MTITPRLSEDFTALLGRHHAGDPAAFAALVDEAYDEMRGVVRKRRSRDHRDAQTTMLVHDVLLALGAQHTQLQNREHFFALAVTLLIRIENDLRKHESAEKRGGGATHEPIREDHAATTPGDAGRAYDAICTLRDVDARAAEVTALKLVADKTESEIAALLGVTERTVQRDWKFARTWMRAYLRGEADG